MPSETGLLARLIRFAVSQVLGKKVDRIHGPKNSIAISSGQERRSLLG